MSLIIAKFPNIPGSSTVAGYTGLVEAIGIREVVEIGVSASQAVSGTTGAGGGVGRSKHSNILLVRYKDKASPKLAEACCAAKNLGSVEIYLFRVVGDAAVVYMTYVLGQAYVARIEHDTLDDLDTALQPHLAVSSRGVPVDTPAGLGTVLEPVVAEQRSKRLVPIPLLAMGRGNADNKEIERVWLNANTVTWKYTPFIQGLPQGAIQKGFDFRQGVELAA